MTAVDAAPTSVAAARFGSAREQLELAATSAINAQDALDPDRGVTPYVALVWLRDARRHLERAEAAIRLGEAAQRTRETAEQ